MKHTAASKLASAISSRVPSPCTTRTFPPLIRARNFSASAPSTSTHVSRSTCPRNTSVTAPYPGPSSSTSTPSGTPAGVHGSRSSPVIFRYPADEHLHACSRFIVERLLACSSAYKVGNTPRPSPSRPKLKTPQAVSCPEKLFAHTQLTPWHHSSSAQLPPNQLPPTRLPARTPQPAPRPSLPRRPHPHLPPPPRPPAPSLPSQLVALLNHLSFVHLCSSVLSFPRLRP